MDLLEYPLYFKSEALPSSRVDFKLFATGLYTEDSPDLWVNFI
jgi:hypothetical protein